MDRDAHERDGCAPPLKTRIPSMGTRTLFADGAAPPAEGCRIEPHGPPHKEPSCVSPRERRAPPAEGEVHRRHSRASPFDADPHERDSCASHSETCILSLETLILPAGTRIPSANATAHPVEGRPHQSNGTAHGEPSCAPARRTRASPLNVDAHEARSCAQADASQAATAPRRPRRRQGSASVHGASTRMDRSAPAPSDRRGTEGDRRPSAPRRHIPTGRQRQRRAKARRVGPTWKRSLLSDDSNEFQLRAHPGRPVVPCVP